jgi:hypothetical protein
MSASGLAVRAPAPERLGDRHRAVDELLLWREQRQLDAPAGQVAQGEERLEPGHAAAGNQDLKWTRTHHRGA